MQTRHKAGATGTAPDAERARTGGGPASSALCAFGVRAAPARAKLRRAVSGVANLLGHSNPDGDEDQEDDDLLHRISRVSLFSTSPSPDGSARIVALS